MINTNNNNHISSPTPLSGDFDLRVTSVKRRPAIGWEDALRRGEEPRFVYEIEGVTSISDTFRSPDGSVSEETRVVNASLLVDVPRDDEGNFGLSGLERFVVVTDDLGNARIGPDGEPLLSVDLRPVTSPIAASPVIVDGRATAEAQPLPDGTPVPASCLEYLVVRDHSKMVRVTNPTVSPSLKRTLVPGSRTDYTRVTVADARGVQYVYLRDAEDYDIVAAPPRLSAKFGFAPVTLGAPTRVPERKAGGGE